MNSSLNDDQMDQIISGTLGTPSPPDFGDWQKKHPEAVACLNTQYSTLLMKRNRKMKRFMKLASTVALVALVMLGISFLGGEEVPNVAFADVVAQIKKAKTIQWKETYLSEAIGKDQRSKWLETLVVHRAFKAPGLYWSVSYDKRGNKLGVLVSDNVNLKEFWIDYNDKQAGIRAIVVAFENVEDPFDWVTNQPDGKFRFVETKKVDGRAVNVFRHIKKDVEMKFRDELATRDRSYDYWLDAKSKELVRVQSPGEDFFDPESDPILLESPQKEWSKKIPLAIVRHDIVFNVELDDELFSMRPPEGFEFTVQERSDVTEEKMIEFLGLVAEFYDGRFPELSEDSILWSPPGTVEGKLYASRPFSQWTKVERKLNDIVQICRHKNQQFMPFIYFILNSTVQVKDGWRYVGKGVKLGEAERIVCWYQLKKTKQYRAVYGDLSVKDISPDDLPKDVKP